MRASLSVMIRLKGVENVSKVCAASDFEAEWVMHKGARNDLDCSTGWGSMYLWSMKSGRWNAMV